VGLTAQVDDTFSNDSSKLLVSPLPPLFSRSMGKMAIWACSPGVSLPPSDERETEWNDETEDAGT
jgi:hypothetical protein